MRAALPIASIFASGLCLAPAVCTAVESQALAIAESLPATISQAFRCGSWSEHGQRGHYRFVLAEVSGGAGTEVYLQRILESAEDSNQVLRIVATTPIHELNNDHQQYQVSSARCVGRASVELSATYEHDEGNIQRRIRLVVARSGAYTISNVITPATKPSR